MQPTFTVQLVEGGRAAVAPGDPSYALCQEIRSKGYRQLYMPLLTVVTGRPSEVIVMKGEEIDILNAAAWIDQRPPMQGECQHHWKIETPPPGFPDQLLESYCKHCGKTREFKQTFPDEPMYHKFAYPDGTKPTPELAQRAKWIHEDWVARLASAEALVQSSVSYSDF